MRGVIVKLGYAINYAKRIRPGSAFPDEVYIQWLNQIEGLVQTDIWMLFPEDCVSYHTAAGAEGKGAVFPDDKTLRFESDPGFYPGGEVTLSGFVTYAANNSEKARVIVKRSADGLEYEFAEGTFSATGTEPEESATAAVSYTEYEKELLVPKPHDKLYLSYLLAMIDLANAETRNYANSITVFNEDYQEYSGYYGLNVNPADGRAEFKGYYISAYSIARKNGFVGTEEEWLASLAGSRGRDGAPGAPIVIRDMYETVEALTANVTAPSLGDMYAVGTEASNVVYFWNGTAWVCIGAVRGADGAPGGKGNDGAAATVSIGTVTTGAAGSAASVTNSGTTSAAVLDFVIPRGQQGNPGKNGDKGDKGDPGEDFKILGYYDTLSALEAAVVSPSAGDAYGVGTAAPYDIYVYDGVSGTWVNNGSIQGPAGKNGDDGADGREVELQTSSTHIQWRYAGETTWNDLVPLASLKGAKGDKGDDGNDGVGVAGVTFKESDASGNNVYTITLTNGATYDFTAPKGAQGSAGPNTVSTTTATNITGLLKGNGSTVSAAVAGTDYAAASHTHSYIPTSEKGAASGVATLDADTKVTASQAAAAVVSISASMTLASAHAGRFLSCTNADAITITIPTGIAAGTEIEIYRGGAGTVMLSPASGVTVECKEASYGIADQYTSVVLKWRTDSIVVLEGNVG